MDCLLKGDVFYIYSVGEWGKAGFFSAFFFVFAELDEAAVLPYFGVDVLASFGVYTESIGGIIAFYVAGIADEFAEWGIEIAEDF